MNLGISIGVTNLIHPLKILSLSPVLAEKSLKATIESPMLD